jgi:hypothetical protein
VSRESIDADTDADHQRQLWCPVDDVDDLRADDRGHREADEHREQRIEQRQAHRDDPERQEQHDRRDENAEKLTRAALLGRRPVDDVATERDLDAVLAVQLEGVFGHRLDALGVDVATRSFELDLGERDLPVARHRRALCERVADGQDLGRLLDRGDRLLDRRAIARVDHAALLDREDDGGCVARLLWELLLQQVVCPLGLRARQAEGVDVLPTGGDPEADG